MKKISLFVSSLIVCMTLAVQASGTSEPSGFGPSTVTALVQHEAVAPSESAPKKSLKERALKLKNDLFSSDSDEAAAPANAEDSNESSVKVDTTSPPLSAGTVEARGPQAPVSQQAETPSTLTRLLGYFTVGAMFWWILVLVMVFMPFPLIASERRRHPWYAALLLIVGLTVNFSANPDIWGRQLAWFFGSYLLLILVWGRVRFTEIRSRTDRHYKQAVRKFIEEKNLRGTDGELATKIPTGLVQEFDRYWSGFANNHGVTAEVVEYKGKTARHINMLAIYFPWDMLATAWRWVFSEFIEMLLDWVRELLLKDNLRSNQYYQQRVHALPGMAKAPVETGRPRRSPLYDD